MLIVGSLLPQAYCFLFPLLPGRGDRWPGSEDNKDATPSAAINLFDVVDVAVSLLQVFGHTFQRHNNNATFPPADDDATSSLLSPT